MFERALRLTALLCLLWMPIRLRGDRHQLRTYLAGAGLHATHAGIETAHTLQPVHLKNPERLVVDLEDVEINAALNELVGKIGSDDPYIKSVRIGRFKPGVVRLVLDLKAQVKPQLFSLQPVAEYGHRLVLDVYPLVAIDPLMALAQQGEIKLAASEPVAASAVVETPARPNRLSLLPEPSPSPNPCHWHAPNSATAC